MSDGCYLRLASKSAAELQTLAKKQPGSRIFPFFCIVVGLVILGSIFWPIFAWELSFAFEGGSGGEIIHPVPDLSFAPQNPTRLPRASSGFGAILLAREGQIIASKVSLPPQSKFDKKAFISEFTISIPKLKIFDARVKVDAEEFDEALALYPGTALPGEIGNAFISGHSVLPQFFNPKDYKKIFATLPQLKIGDEIIANVAGVEYRYLVESKRVIDPSDVSVIYAPVRDRCLTLMTCVPPGTSLKRLIVTSCRLVDNL